MKPELAGDLSPTITQQALSSIDLREVEIHEVIREGIARGERAIQEGKIRTHQEAKRRMARWLKD